MIEMFDPDVKQAVASYFSAVCLCSNRNTTGSGRTCLWVLDTDSEEPQT